MKVPHQNFAANRLSRGILLPSFLLLLFLLPCLQAQSLPAAPRTPGLPPVPTSLEDRRKALAEVDRDYWEDVMKHNPEFASVLGDTRYNDQVTNYTSSAFNDELSREQNYLLQIAVIDMAGFTDEERQLQQALDRRLEEDLKNADNKPWETPVTAASSFYAVYPKLAQVLPFTTAKDYDDWTARLRLLPEAFSQAMQDMSLGIDDGRVPPKDVLDKALAEVSMLGHQKPEDSPLTAPLKKFPATISAAEQDRIRQEMTGAAKDALAAYLRLERFLRISYVPAAGKGQLSSGTRCAQLLSTVIDLRSQAEQTMGSRFDPKTFRDEVLKAGLLAPDQMRNQVESWIKNPSR